MRNYFPLLSLRLTTCGPSSRTEKPLPGVVVNTLLSSARGYGWTSYNEDPPQEIVFLLPVDLSYDQLVALIKSAV